MPRRRAFRRSARKSKDLIWITTIVESSLVDPSVLDVAQVVIPSDWSVNAGFDRATLMAVRGWLAIAQEAASTPSEATGLWLAMYVTDAAVPTGTFDANDASDYVTTDVIYTAGLALTATTGTNPAPGSAQVEIKARRKLTSASEVRLGASLPADTATARVNIVGCLRALLRLDPPA